VASLQRSLGAYGSFDRVFAFADGGASWVVHSTPSPECQQLVQQPSPRQQTLYGGGGI
jgi:hypothetical protein